MRTGSDRFYVGLTHTLRILGVLGVLAIRSIKLFGNFCVSPIMDSLLPGGWAELMQRNHQLALEARHLLCEAVEVQTPCPEEMIGSLENRDFMSLHDELFDKFGIQVQVSRWVGKFLARVRQKAVPRLRSATGQEAEGKRVLS